MKYFTMKRDCEDDGIRTALLFSHIVTCLIFLPLLPLQNDLNYIVRRGPGEL